MEDKQQPQLIKCCQCGYQFKPTPDLRCPRCNSPVFKYGGCTGSCSTCSKK